MFLCIGSESESVLYLKPDYENLDINHEQVLKQTGNNGKVDNLWTILDSQSTVYLFCNAKILRNIYTV